MNQRWRLLALWLLPIGVVLLIGWQVVSNGGINGLSQDSNGTTVAPRNAAVARMSYGRFLDYVEAGRVTAVDIYDGGCHRWTLRIHWAVLRSRSSPTSRKARPDCCPEKPLIKASEIRSIPLH